MPSIASNSIITLLIITLNNLLYRTMRLINAISSNLLGDPNEFSSRISVFLILRARERFGNVGNFLGGCLVSPLSWQEVVCLWKRTVLLFLRASQSLRSCHRVVWTLGPPWWSTGPICVRTDSGVVRNHEKPLREDHVVHETGEEMTEASRKEHGKPIRGSSDLQKICGITLVLEAQQ